MALRFLSPGFLRRKGLAGLTKVIAGSTELRSERISSEILTFS
jgi:hypothetical protein